MEKIHLEYMWNHPTKRQSSGYQAPRLGESSRVLQKFSSLVAGQLYCGETEKKVAREVERHWFTGRYEMRLPLIFHLVSGGRGVPRSDMSKDASRVRPVLFLLVDAVLKGFPPRGVGVGSLTARTFLWKRVSDCLCAHSRTFSFVGSLGPKISVATQMSSQHCSVESHSM